jgi:hypothetical protein
MTDERTSKITRMAQLLTLEKEVSANYSRACSILEDCDVVLALKFLIELDILATRHDFSPREIITILKPGYFQQAGVSREPIESSTSRASTP